MIVVCTEYGSNYAGIAAITVPLMKEYCERHGYQFRELILEGTGNEYYYKKNEFFDELFKEGVEAIFYLDADALITNLNIRVETFIDDEHSFFITEHIGELNGGALIIKNNAGGVKINDFILSEKCNFANEQNCINHYRYFPPFHNQMKVVDHPSFNSLNYELYPELPHIRKREEGHWHEGDFVLHTPGLGIEHRKQILSEAKIIRWTITG